MSAKLAIKNSFKLLLYSCFIRPCYENTSQISKTEKRLTIKSFSNDSELLEKHKSQDQVNHKNSNRMIVFSLFIKNNFKASEKLKLIHFLKKSSYKTSNKLKMYSCRFKPVIGSI